MAKAKWPESGRRPYGEQNWRRRCEWPGTWEQCGYGGKIVSPPKVYTSGNSSVRLFYLWENGD